MSELKWKAEVQGSLVTVWQVIETDGHFEDVIADELTEKQARLIAAAPLMHEALELAEDKVSLNIGRFREKYGTFDWDWANKRITELRRAALAQTEER